MSSDINNTNIDKANINHIETHDSNLYDYKFMKPAEIEKESMRIIAETLQEMGVTIPEENAAVVKRVIHTSADFDYAENLYFTDNAVQRAIERLQRPEVHIVTDTNMALSGINKTGLSKLGGDCHCYMADNDIATAAREKGTTRAYMAMEHAAGLYPDAIFAIGNAPTALIRLDELIEEGLRPSLIIGVPVGFVNVASSKSAIIRTCEQYNIPAIVARGNKGGSNIAAAIVNALVYSVVNRDMW